MSTVRPRRPSSSRPPSRWRPRPSRATRRCRARPCPACGRTSPSQEISAARTPATRALPPDPEAGRRADGPCRAAARGRAARPASPARRARPGVLIASAGAAALCRGDRRWPPRSGRSSGGRRRIRRPPATNLATAGPLELGFPELGSGRRTRTAIPGLTLEDETALAPLRARLPAGDALRVGTTNAGGPSLLPASFLARLDEAPDRGDAVKLGELEAYRYHRTAPAGLRRTPHPVRRATTEGVATVACTGGGGASAGFLADCEEVATGLALATGKAFPLGPDEQYLDKLGASMDRLNANRRSGTRKLRQAKKQAAQAKAAESRLERLPQRRALAQRPLGEPGGAGRQQRGALGAERDRGRLQTPGRRDGSQANTTRRATM